MYVGNETSWNRVFARLLNDSDFLLTRRIGNKFWKINVKPNLRAELWRRLRFSSEREVWRRCFAGEMKPCESKCRVRALRFCTFVHFQIWINRPTRRTKPFLDYPALIIWNLSYFAGRRAIFSSLPSDVHLSEEDIQKVLPGDSKSKICPAYPATRQKFRNPVRPKRYREKLLCRRLLQKVRLRRRTKCCRLDLETINEIYNQCMN